MFRSDTNPRSTRVRLLARKATEMEAIKLAKQGHPVVILHGIRDGKCLCRNPNCASPGKHPVTSHGVKDATTNVKKIKRLLTANPDANIAVATTRGVLVLDVDPKNGGTKTMVKLVKELGSFTKGPKVMTGGGGRHFYFAMPAFKVRRDAAGKIFGAGVDVLTNSSFAVVPPSVHASGRHYEWAEGRSLSGGIKLGQLPKSWLSRLKAHTATMTAPKTTTRSDPPKIREGARDTTLTSIGGTLRNTGLAEHSLFAALAAINAERCDPPLDEAQVKKIAASLSRYPAAANDNTAHPQREYKVMDAVQTQLAAQDRRLMFMQGHGWYQYDGKFWSSIRHKSVEKEVLRHVEHLPPDMRGKATAVVSDVMQLMSIALTPDHADPIHRQSPRPVVNCLNGEVWINGDGTVELRKHDPESYLTNLLNVEYDPAAKAPLYKQAVNAIFSETGDSEAMLRYWDEVVGYLIQPRRDLAVIFLLLGFGNNGKTEIMRTVFSLIGQNFVYSAKLGDLEGNRFAMGHLRDKLIFYDDDIKSGAKLPDGILKTISEDKIITGELKNKDSFEYRNTAVPVLLANNAPTTSDNSEGLRRRIHVIPFDHTFVQGKDLDPKLWPLIRETEMAGVLNRAITGLQRLRKRGRFDKPEAVRKADQDWFQKANPLQAFLAERTVVQAGAKSLVSDLYRAYELWADDGGIKFHIQKHTLARQLKQLGYNIGDSSRGTIVIGLAIKK